MNTHPCIYYSNGVFLVFNKELAKLLRLNRIVSQPIGCSPRNPHQVATSGLPYLISHYAARVVTENNLAKVQKLILQDTTSIEDNETRYVEEYSRLKDEAQRRFIEERIEELRRRKIEPTPRRLGEFDERKMKLKISVTPNASYSPFKTIDMDSSELSLLFGAEDARTSVFRDLYHRGFYISCGTKFGGDFIVYLEDPVRYHAQYAVRVVPHHEGLVDLSKISYNEINALNRLCHGANKTPLYAVVYRNPDGQEKIKYWTLKPREFLTPDSDNKIFDRIDLSDKACGFGSIKVVEGTDNETLSLNKMRKF